MPPFAPPLRMSTHNTEHETLLTLTNCAGYLLTLRVYAKEKRKKSINPDLSRAYLIATFDITWVAVVQPTGAQNLISSLSLFLISFFVRHYILRSLFNLFKYNSSTFFVSQ